MHGEGGKVGWMDGWMHGWTGQQMAVLMSVPGTYTQGVIRGRGAKSPLWAAEALQPFHGLPRPWKPSMGCRGPATLPWAAGALQPFHGLPRPCKLPAALCRATPRHAPRAAARRICA
eukprot:347250-Chlamydomonas_euryale.AAC.2